MARLAPCYHGNEDWCGMARSMEGERRGRKGRKSPPAVPYQQQKPWGNLGKEKRVHPQLPLSYKRIFPSASTPTCPPVSSPLISIICSFILPSSSCFPPLTPYLPSLFFQSFLSLFSLCVCPFLLSFSIPQYELIMTVVWSTVVKENCNYKNVSPGYTNRNETGAITIGDICTLLET